MFRAMRRFRQQLPQTECENILNRNTSGTLALLGDDGYPYSLPISFLYANGKIYFHCAKTGHKIDAVRSYEKASFSVIDRDDVQEKTFTTHYKSVICFGKIRLVDDKDEMRKIAYLLAKKYSPNMPEEAINHEIEREFSALLCMELTVEHMTGKQAVELMKN